MKLNYDCIRDVLIYLEKQDYYIASEDQYIESNPIEITKMAEDLPEYSFVDLYYTLKNLDEADYIELLEIGADCGIIDASVNRITFKGHEFLERIRDSARWTTVKKVLSSVKDYSLSAIGAIASGVTGAMIDKYIQHIG